MAKLNTSPLGSFSQAALTTINANMDVIEAAIENTLSRDGTSPNQMTADFDMNHNDILNVGTLDVDNLTVDNLTAGQTNTDILYLGGVRVTPTGLDETLPTFPTLSASQKFKDVKVNSTGTGFKFLRSPLFDPFDYGATGNGVTDDTVALVACQTAANANESVEHGGTRGRGIIVLPTGKFKTTGITTQNPNEFWMGLGGTLDAMAANQTVFTCAHGRCTVENMIISQTFRPTTNSATFLHNSLTAQGSPDCMFRKLLIVGGYYGIEGDGATLYGAGDSIWMDCKVVGCYSDFVYLHGYNGFWGIRNKFDDGWPTAVSGHLHPTTAEIRGAWAPSTPYVLHEVVTSNGFYFQCAVSGTSSAGAGPVAALKGTAIVDGSAQWKVHRTTQASAIHIDSDCFINVMWLTDMTGGHINSVWLTNLTGTNRPQTVKFLDGCEFGSPLIYGIRADAADDIEIGSIVIDNCIDTTVGTGVITNNVRGIAVHDTMLRQMFRGVSIGPATTGSSVNLNSFGGVTGWCAEFQANTSGFQAIGNKCGGTPWGNNGNGIRVMPGTSNEYIVALNQGIGIVGLRWSDLGTGINKYFDGNV